MNMNDSRLLTPLSWLPQYLFSETFPLNSLKTIFIFHPSTECPAAQSRRSSPLARSLGINPKSYSSSASSSSSSRTADDFVCPEEFGYYSHPTDCSLYYVCVFGGALLESCTGGLMYSHELQTCDWPRNVGCEVAEAETDVVPSPQSRQSHQLSSDDGIRQRVSSHHGQVARNEQPQSDSPVISLYPVARGQPLPPPPELRIAPKPVVTSRGHPKPFQSDEIAKVKSAGAIFEVNRFFHSIFFCR